MSLLCIVDHNYILMANLGLKFCHNFITTAICTQAIAYDDEFDCFSKKMLL